MHSEGPKAAIEWLEKGGLGIDDLDSDGKLFLLQGCMDARLWVQALEHVERLSENDFENTPTLLLFAALVHLAQVIADEFRGVALHSVPFEASSYPLAADESAFGHRRQARALFQRAEAAARSLNVIGAANRASDYAVWLGLRDDADTSSNARRELERSLRDPASSLRRLPIGLQFGIKMDLHAVEQEIDRHTALSGGKSPDAAYARFALALTKESPREIAEYIEQHRGQLELLDKVAIGSIETEVLAKSGQYESAEARLTTLIADGLSADSVTRLRAIVTDAQQGDPIDRRRMHFRETQSLIDLNALTTLLEDKGQWDQLVEYASLQFERTHDLADGKRYANALFQTRHFDELIEFCNTYAPLVAQSRFLERLRCWGLFENGDVIGARAAIQALRDAEDDSDLRQLLVNIAVASGDWEALGRHVENEWAARSDRTGAELLHAGQLAMLINSSRLRDLVVAAAEKGKSDPSVLVGCYSVAAATGWENKEEVATWISAAAALSGPDGPIRQVALKEVLAWRSEWSQREDDVWKRLTRAQLPTFLAAHSLNRTLTRFFVLPALRNRRETDVRKQALIYAFSAGRPSAQNTQKVRVLAMDVSAWLTSELLGVTDKILPDYA